MEALFTNRITPVGREAMRNLIDHVAQELQQTTDETGKTMFIRTYRKAPAAWATFVYGSYMNHGGMYRL